MLGIFRRHRSDLTSVEDETPAVARPTSALRSDSGQPAAHQPLLRTPDGDAESCARATLPLCRGRLIVVIHPDATVMQAATRAARTLGYGAIDGGVDGIAHFVATWRPLAILVEEHDFPALRRELAEARLEAQIVRLSRRAIERPGFHARLTRVLADLAQLLRRREERCGTACPPESARYTGSA